MEENMGSTRLKKKVERDENSLLNTQ